MFNRLRLQESGYFYKIAKKLTTKLITALFSEISNDTSKQPIKTLIRKDNYKKSHDVKISFLFFTISSSPSFLDDGVEREINYGYLLIVEYGDYVVISSKNATGWKKYLEEYLEDINYETLTRFCIDSNTAFEKYSMLNSDVSDAAIRRKTVEAINLNGAFSLYGSNRYILKNIRVNNSDKLISITSNTSHITELGKRANINNYLIWMVDCVKKILTYSHKSTILDNFAKPENIEKKIAALNPVSILLTFNELLASYEAGEVHNTVYKERKINLKTFLVRLKKCSEVISSQQQDKYTAKVATIRGGITIKKMIKSFKLESAKLSNIKFTIDSKNFNLLEYINYNKLFILLFEDISSVYYNNHLFTDSSLLGNMEDYLSIFVPKNELSENTPIPITCEKHNKLINNTLPSKVSAFTKDSIFRFIEDNIAQKVNCLICDDLGDEWADYISIDKNDGVAFYHAKLVDSEISASDLHDVVSQAQKNIGNIYNVKELPRKINSWKIPYSKTKIKRIRHIKGFKIDDLLLEYSKMLRLPNTKKSVIIVINKFSKSKLEAELKNINNNTGNKHQIIQILWLISSLIHSCREASVGLTIYCAP